MELRLLLREAVEQIGADVFSLINWEKGKTEPAIRFWPGIIAFLGYDPSPLPVTLGDHVRAERRRRGCSLALLARECGFDPGTLALIEADAYPRIDPRVRASYEGLQRRYGLTGPLEVDDRQTAKPLTGRNALTPRAVATCSRETAASTVRQFTKARRHSHRPCR